MVKTLKPPTTSSGNILRDFIDGFFGGSFANASYGGTGKLFGGRVEWAITPAAWGGNGDESRWKNSSLNKITDLHTLAFPNSNGNNYSIRLVGAKAVQRRVVLTFQNIHSFRKAYKYFTGEDY